MAIFNLFSKKNKQPTSETQEKSVKPFIDSKSNSKGKTHAGEDVTYTSAMRQADVHT